MYLKLVLKDVRFAYPHLITPKEWQDSEYPEYSVIVVIPKDHPQIDEIRKLEAELKANMMQTNAKFKASQRLQKEFNLLLKDGDEYMNEKGEYLEGCYFFTAKQSIKTATDKIDVFDKFKNRITEEGVLKSGDYGNIVVSLRDYVYSDKFGISCYLKGVQHIEDGDPIGSMGGSTASDFEAVSDDLPF